MRLVALDIKMEEEQFLGMKTDKFAEELFHELTSEYQRRSKAIAEQAMPVFKDIYTTRGETVENIAVPFTDGKRGLQVVANLKKSVESEGRELINAYQKAVTLAIIDEEWKEHLREMDDLKQSVQQAVYEQKDPLLIYKLESFKLFEGLVDRLNRDTVSLLLKGHIMANEGNQKVREAQAERPKTDMSKVQKSREDRLNAPQEPRAEGQAKQRAQQNPIKADLKDGRNDPCPCGSGKKFKK